MLRLKIDCNSSTTNVPIPLLRILAAKPTRQKKIKKWRMSPSFSLFSLILCDWDSPKPQMRVNANSVRCPYVSTPFEGVSTTPIRPHTLPARQRENRTRHGATNVTQGEWWRQPTRPNKPPSSAQYACNTFEGEYDKKNYIKGREKTRHQTRPWFSYILCSLTSCDMWRGWLVKGESSTSEGDYLAFSTPMDTPVHP